jgi:hypothetical protein
MEGKTKNKCTSRILSYPCNNRAPFLFDFLIIILLENTSILSVIFGKSKVEVIEWLMQKLAIRFPLNAKGIL